MPFDWDEYRRIAEELRQRPIEDEAAQRTAISRIYYAVYWKARILLEEEGIHVPRSDSHGFVWKQFSGRGRTFGSVANKAKSLRDRREMADYESSIPQLQKEVDFSFELARFAFTYLNQIEENRKKSSS
jgi:uncharacterized protein (UPF0332 family)